MASVESEKTGKDDRSDDAEAISCELFDFVRFTIADINGIARSKLIPRRHVANSLATGITMCSRAHACMPPAYLAVVSI